MSFCSYYDLQTKLLFDSIHEKISSQCKSSINLLEGDKSELSVNEVLSTLCREINLFGLLDYQVFVRGS